MNTLSRYLYPLQYRQAPPGDAYTVTGITNDNSKGIILKIVVGEEGVRGYLGGKPFPRPWLRVHVPILEGLPHGSYDAFVPGHDLTDLTLRRQENAVITLFDRESQASFSHRLKRLKELPVDNKRVKVANWVLTPSYTPAPGLVIAHSLGEWMDKPDVFLSYFPANEMHTFVLKGLEDGDLLKCETLQGQPLYLSGAFIKEHNNINKITKGYQTINITFNAVEGGEKRGRQTRVRS